MRNSLTMISALFSLVLVLQVTATEAYAGSASSFSCPKVKSLTAAQCVKLRADLEAYIVFVTRYFGSGPLVQAVIRFAKADVNRLCPVPPGNGWTPDTQNECAVPSPGNTTVVSLALDSSGSISNAVTPYKVICMSESACNTIVSQKFFVYGASPTQRCSDPNDLSVQHLSDAQVQSKISQLP